MTVSTLRPSSTTSHTGALTGGATAHAVLLDDSDSSYTTLDMGELVGVGFDDFTLPAGAVIKRLGIRTRVSKNGVATPTITVEPNVSATGLSGAFPVSWVSPATVTSGQSVEGDPDNTDAVADAMIVVVENFSGSGIVRVYELFVDVTHVIVPVVAIDAVTDPTTDTNQPTFTWVDTLDSDGGAQTFYEVKVFSSAQYGAGGFDPDTSTPTATSGITSGTATSWQVDEILPDDTYRAYVRVAQTVVGDAHWSDWDFDEFTVTVDLPAAPTFTATADDANARIELSFDDNAGDATTDFFEVARSLDGGTTWEEVRQEDEGYLTPTAGAFTLYDYEAPNGTAVTYRGRALHDYSGVYAASAWVEDTETWESTAWWVKHPQRPDLNTSFKVRSFKAKQRASRAGVFQALGAAAPVVVQDKRETARGEIVLRMDSAADQEALDALLDESATLLIQGPAGSDEPGYVAVLDHQRERAIDWNTATPSFDTLQFVTTEQPVGTITEGVIVSVVNEAVLNVETYGATGDGSDESDAFTAALADVNGGTLYLPRGHYRVADLVIPDEGVTLMGDGLGTPGDGQGTVLEAFTGADYVLKVEGKRYLELRNLVIDGNGRDSAGLLYEATASATNQSMLMSRVRFYECTRGWHLGDGAGGVSQTDKNTLVNCDFFSCDYGIYNEAVNSQQTVLMNCDFGGTYVTSIYLEAGWLTMIGGQFQGFGAAGTRGIHFAGFNIGMLNLKDVIFEGPDMDIDDGGSMWPHDGVIVENVAFQGPTWNVQCNTEDARMTARHSRFNADFDPYTLGGGIISWNQAGGQLILEHCDYGVPTITGAVKPRIRKAFPWAVTLASAATLSPEPGAETATVTGSTTITGITAQPEGALLDLLFASTAQVTDGGNLLLAGNFTGGAGRVLSLRSDGTNWWERGRSTN
jgi:hypothetical protein